jgi:hypothetical protein
MAKGPPALRIGAELEVFLDGRFLVQFETQCWNWALAEVASQFMCSVNEEKRR